MEKERLRLEIQKLLSFDGDAVEINPDYLEYFTLEELEKMLEELRRRQEKMVEENRDWMRRFVRTEEGPKKGS